MIVIDKEIVKKRFGRSMATYDQHATVQRRICKEMICCLQQNTNTLFKNLLEVGCGSGLLTDGILNFMSPERYYINDIIPAKETEIARVFDRHQFNSWLFLEGDAEKIAFPAQLDGIITTSTVQWFNKLPAFFEKVYDSLKAGGIFAFSTFGPENFSEIKSTMEQGLHYASKNELLTMLPNGFEVLCTRDYLDKLSFQNPVEILRHIKLTGVNGIASPFWSRKDLRHFEEKYFENNRQDEMESVGLTYHPIIIIAKKKS